VRQINRVGQMNRSLAAASASGLGAMRRVLVAVVAVAILVGFDGTGGAYAATPGAPTRGDAQGIFQAFFTGGSAIRAHNHEASGVPGVPAETTPDGARIYPLLDDLQYCDQGWHVVLLGFFDDPAFYAGGNKELFDLLSAVDVRFTLDGIPLPTERTAIKRLAHTDPAFIEEAFFVGFGAFLPPGALSLGTHELHTFQHDPVFGDEQFVTPFTVVAC
jgi:hypothetical protein